MSVTTQSNPAKDFGGATADRQTEVDAATAGNEYSHSLIADMKQAVIRARGKDATLKISTTSDGTNTGPYMTLEGCAVMTLDKLRFTGKTLYIQSDKDSTTIEVWEFY